MGEYLDCQKATPNTLVGENLIDLSPAITLFLKGLLPLPDIMPNGKQRAKTRSNL